MSWADLFERADAYGTDAETIRETLAARRNAAKDADGGEEEEANGDA